MPSGLDAENCFGEIHANVYSIVKSINNLNFIILNEWLKDKKNRHWGESAIENFAIYQEMNFLKWRENSVDELRQYLNDVLNKDSA